MSLLASPFARGTAAVSGVVIGGVSLAVCSPTPLLINLSNFVTALQ